MTAGITTLTFDTMAAGSESTIHRFSLSIGTLAACRILPGVIWHTFRCTRARLHVQIPCRCMHCGNKSDSNLSKEFAPPLHRVLPLNAGRKSRAHVLLRTHSRTLILKPQLYTLHPHNPPNRESEANRARASLVGAQASLKEQGCMSLNGNSLWTRSLESTN